MADSGGHVLIEAANTYHTTNQTLRFWGGAFFQDSSKLCVNEWLSHVA